MASAEGQVGPQALDLSDTEAVEARKRVLRSATFDYRGERLGYHVDGGNRPFDNERAVELAIAVRVLTEHADPETIVEVGNVLPHYLPTQHAVLDKFEHHRKVTWNEDVLEFRPPFEPELILSVSTLEHVGHVERPPDPTGFPRAVAALRSWLAPGGQLFFTVPLGYNPSVLELLENASDSFDEVTVMRRISTENEWAPSSLEEVRDLRYGQPFPCANAVAIVRASRQPAPESSPAPSREARARAPERAGRSAELRQTYNRRYYEHMAGGAVHARGGDLRELTNIWRAASLVMAPKTFAVTDVGAGRGELARHFVEKGTQVNLLDYAEPAIEIAREYVGDSDLANYIVGDAGRLAEYIEPRSQDAVFMTDVVEHISEDELRVIFGQIREVLAPGGVLVVHTPEKYYGSVTLKSAVQGVHISLFEIDTLRELLSESFPFVDTFTWNGFERFASKGKCIELFGVAGSVPYLQDKHPSEMHQTSETRLTTEHFRGWVTQDLVERRGLPERFTLRFDLEVVRADANADLQVLLVGDDGATVAWTGTTLSLLRDSPADVFLTSAMFNRVDPNAGWEVVRRISVRLRSEEGGVHLCMTNIRIVHA
jgi:2-polyprenyl-3-methyl-5-hydroxy-6-metoxy-1,4-benzoquinol methylase